MKFWTFAGEGISSRLADQCLLCLSGDEQCESKLGLPHHPDHLYSEYYQKHIPLSSVKDAKDAIRVRYAGIIQGRGNIRGVPGVSIEDVFLYPTEMSAILAVPSTTGWHYWPKDWFKHLEICPCQVSHDRVI